MYSLNKEKEMGLQYIFGIFNDEQLETFKNLDNVDKLMKRHYKNKMIDIADIYMKYMSLLFGFNIQLNDDIVDMINKLVPINRKNFIYFYYIIANSERYVVGMKKFSKFLRLFPFEQNNKGNIFVCDECGIFLNIIDMYKINEVNSFYNLSLIRTIHDTIADRNNIRCNSDSIINKCYIPIVKRSENKKIFSKISALKDKIGKNGAISYHRIMNNVFKNKFKLIMNKYNLDKDDYKKAINIMRNYYKSNNNDKNHPPHLMAVIFLFFIVNEKLKSENGKDPRIKSNFSNEMNVSLAEFFKLDGIYYKKIKKYVK